jgi:predicted lipoprotein with Yx(FWY)xxD motif
MVEVEQRGKSQLARRTRRARRQRLAVDGLAGAVVLTGFAVGMVNVSGASMATSHAAKSVKVSSTTIKNVGTVLTTGSGLTLYRFTADPMGKSVCTGACAKIWPPLTASKGEHVQGPKGVKGLSLINVGHGRWQVAFHNVALYRFTGDTKKGQDHGQNVAHMWFAVLKSGIPTSATTPTTAPGSSALPSTSTTQASSGAVTPVTPSTAATMGGQTSPATTPANPAPTPVTSPPVTSPPPRPTTTTTAPPTGGGAAF